MKKHTIVTWPESQALMDHPRFEECQLINDETGIELYGGSAYFVPNDIVEELEAADMVRVHSKKK